MTTSEDIEAQQNILATYRRTLALYLVQQAAQGGLAYVVPAVANGIVDARAEIQRSKETLRAWGVAVEDHPDDGSAADGAPAATAARVGAGLQALSDLLHMPGARSAVAVYQASFQVACRQIEALGVYKKLHDLFQQLDDRYTIVVRFSKSLPANQAAWEDVERDEPELYVAADLLLAQAAGPALAGESALWAQKLGRAQRELRAALEVCAADRLKDALALLKDVIDRQLSRTNTRLVAAADALDLATLVGALRTVCDQLARIARDPGAAGRLDDFRRGVDALAELDRRLTTAVGLHTAFQEIDDELRLIEGLLEQEPGGLAETWQDLAPLRRAICESNPAEWAAKLTRLAADLEVALAAADVLRLRRSFGRYRSQAVQSFNQVDHDLMSLCAELQQVGAPLDQVLRVLE